jgi:hypothetical protein
MESTNLILTMPDKLKNIKWGGYSFNFLLSVFIHSILFLGTAYLFSLTFEKPIINSVYLTLPKNESTAQKELIKELLKEDATNPEQIATDETTGAFLNFNKADYDTSKIKQVYKESTLNVSVRYPNDWTYLDQNVKNKLDGVTFWSAKGNYDIPPYIHLEVQDKYIFNPARWENKLEHKGNIYYYNEPEEIEGYFTQIIYIRTDSEEDYSLKLMTKGKEVFQSFQPVFFSMAKSFRFGRSFL